MNHHLRLSLLTSILLGLTLAASSNPARAQTAVALDKSFEGDLFGPAIGPRNFLTIDAPEVPAHKLLSFGLFFDYQTDPYKVYAMQTGQPRLTTYLISSQFKSELQAAVGILDRFQVGVSLPITLTLSGQQIDPTMGVGNGLTLSTAGLGDLRIEAKGQLMTAGADDQFVLAALLGGTAPTGNSHAYLGNGGPTGRAKALASLQVGRFRLGGNLGLLLRPTATSLDATVGHQLLYGGAGSVQVLKGFEVLGEVSGRSGLTDFSRRYWDENPVEVDLAARLYPTGMLAVTFGIGTGLGKGIGAPGARLFLGAVFAPDFRDADHDGIYDSEDRCPDQPEDRDGFKDNDGCPDPDNDADGIPDIQDKCPNDAEDFDQFEDEDGCPELDNDKDGIPDLNDPCPNAAEDGLGKRPHDGCPSTAEDSDGDGVNDTVDKCPDEPEDRDGFQDDDGCPDPDNDGDGIPDGFDNCPNDPEDADGFEDEDGCPDPDNDKDGIPDSEDKCPDKPETLNGIQDEDGCPDAGPEIVKLGDGAIEVLERLHFTGKGGQTELKENGVKAIRLVALVLKGHPEITKLRIEVHAEGVPKEESQRRAEMIRDILVRKGVDTARLTPVGTQAGAARVVFIIAERAIHKATGTGPAPAGGTDVKSGTAPTNSEGGGPRK